MGGGAWQSIRRSFLAAPARPTTPAAASPNPTSQRLCDGGGCEPRGSGGLAVAEWRVSLSGLAPLGVTAEKSRASDVLAQFEEKTCQIAPGIPTVAETGTRGPRVVGVPAGPRGAPAEAAIEVRLARAERARVPAGRTRRVRVATVTSDPGAMTTGVRVERERTGHAGSMIDRSAPTTIDRSGPSTTGVRVATATSAPGAPTTTADRLGTVMIVRGVSRIGPSGASMTVGLAVPVMSVRVAPLMIGDRAVTATSGPGVPTTIAVRVVRATIVRGVPMTIDVPVGTERAGPAAPTRIGPGVPTMTVGLPVRVTGGRSARTVSVVRVVMAMIVRGVSRIDPSGASMTAAPVVMATSGPGVRSMTVVPVAMARSARVVRSMTVARVVRVMIVRGVSRTGPSGASMTVARVATARSAPGAPSMIVGRAATARSAPGVPTTTVDRVGTVMTGPGAPSTTAVRAVIGTTGPHAVIGMTAAPVATETTVRAGPSTTVAGRTGTSAPARTAAASERTTPSCRRRSSSRCSPVRLARRCAG